VEFCADKDKIPLVDPVWDVFQSVLRIPAGHASGHWSSGQDPTTCALINILSEPLSNLGASLAEDTALVGALWLAWNHPLATIRWRPPRADVADDLGAVALSENCLARLAAAPAGYTHGHRQKIKRELTTIFYIEI
jgi:hypothetical protein